MSRWLAGYTKAELDGAQERYCVRFPPDLVDLFLDRRPDIGYAWEVEDNRIREMLDWPFNMLSFDVERGYWWPEWGERPSTVDERREQGATLRELARSYDVSLSAISRATRPTLWA